MKLSVILAALAGLAVAAWFVIQVGFAAVLGAIASIGWTGFAILCAYALAAFVVLGAAWFVLIPSAPFWDFTLYLPTNFPGTNPEVLAQAVIARLPEQISSMRAAGRRSR